MRSNAIRIRGARVHNLRDVEVALPRHRLIAITGVSGSGKSSLAFDTLFREGQRRFLETLSAYARQFLGRMEKPDVESIEGLSPAIAVDQAAASTSPRSTVGTLTEIFDHLRVLYARAGRAHCAKCQLPLQALTPEGIVTQALDAFEGRSVSVLAPIVRDRKGQHKEIFESLARRGLIRARVDGEIVRIEEAPELARYVRHSIDAVVDRLKPEREQPSRLREAITTALELSGGDVVFVPNDAELAERAWSTSRTCPGCGADTPPLEPRLFSFNSPHGACPTCAGLGLRNEPSEARIVRDATLSIREGALAVTRKSGGALVYPHVDFRFLESVAQAFDFDLDTPWKQLSRAARKVVLHGSGDQRFEDDFSWNGEKYQGSVKWQRRFKGVVPALRKAASGGQAQALKYFSSVACPDCSGTRLKPAALAVQFGGASLRELLNLSIADLTQRLDTLQLAAREQRIARDLLAEVRRRIAFLHQVGLDYLTLARGADSLSGGEAQRIRLAAQLGSALQGVLYVLDEPSIGLHARDHAQLLGALQRLRDGGNTVVVVEHVEATLRAADHIVDVGPGAGRNGGTIVAQGTPREVARCDSPTGRFLRGELRIPAPATRRPGNGHRLAVRGARAFNLKGFDVEFPLGALTAVAGVSGSGKSTLIERILEPGLLAHLEREGPEPGAHDALEGLEHVGDLVAIDAAPIGRTPRSNPATYTGAFDPIRDLFASLPESKMRGYTKSRFSFNVEGGRCEACGGAGAKLVELQFLAPVTVPCDECGGERFQAETLDVKFKDKSIADVLEMTVEEALELFKDHPKIARPLAVMSEVGLSYLTLGQPSTTISGGEAQRLKLVAHLQKKPRAHTVYLLDEPTTGLHPQDIAKLVGALQQLVDAGHTVIVIEHNLDVIRAADYVVDLGPSGGEGGGELVACGTPEQIAAHRSSATGAALRGEFARAARPIAERRDADQSPCDVIRVVDACTHNLNHVSVEMPRDALVVITGPSGSGKSSLALDTIYTEGRRRFVESLSTYARQFLGNRDKPPVDRIEGLGPSVAVEAGTSRGHPRSTVATTTEIHDHLRVLWARCGVPHCPTHGVELAKLDPARIAKRVLKEHDGAKGWIVAPICGPGGVESGASDELLAARIDAWRAAGFVRILVDGVEARLDAKRPAVSSEARVDLVVDRLAFNGASRARIAEAAEQAAHAAQGRVSVVVAGGARLEFSTQGACPACGHRLVHKLDPRHFSFNTHAGACPDCDGLGTTSRCDPEKLIERPELGLLEGAVHSRFARYLVKGKGYYEYLLLEVARTHALDLERPFGTYSDAQRALVLFGKGSKPKYSVVIEKESSNAEITERFTADWPGLCGHVDAWHKKTEDPEWAALLETVMTSVTCPTCTGERLGPDARCAEVDGVRLPELMRWSVARSLEWLRRLKIPSASAEAVQPVVAELISRLALLERVGLGYLTLDRPTHTLSGGEARRVRLSANLGSQLVGVCYVLDEPTVGLHPADVEKLTGALLELREHGNSVLVVEHDESLMRRADFIVDMGPGAGRLGGNVVASGTPAEIERSPRSLTGAALRGEFTLERDASRVARAAQAATLELRGALGHNLKGVDYRARFGAVNGVCGPSGSGKSTLILDILVPAMQGERPAGRWKRLECTLDQAPRVVVIDATPIGRTPASTPATYTGVLEPIRELFARTPDARMKGFGPSHFSFNSPKGRCPACEGKGATQVEMQFLADLWLPCEECAGQRFAAEVLEVRYRGKSIADVLELSVDAALEFLAAHPRAVEILRTLSEVGLGYMSLGQSSTTLSGGEAQRVKLASELFPGETQRAPSVVVLDEPSTGLHASDVAKLARVLERLADEGHAVILIEHHTGLLALCDELLELGPGGGEAGGRVIAQGTPEELARDPRSITGPFLARDRRANPPLSAKDKRTSRAEVLR
ncbi:MAG: excinuclease ABC subunit UvrA [Planctomycetes bacterium]|nr:excinuclease ABC subunit UvrA [Planctomycetota bacterium]